MSNLAEEITGFVVGDNLEIRRTVTGLEAPMAIAWLTLKRYPEQADDDAAIQKEITGSHQDGIGEIETPGDVDVDGELRYDFTSAQTTALGALEYVYDIQIKLDNDKIFTLEKGTIQLTADVTRSTS